MLRKLDQHEKPECNIMSEIHTQSIEPVLLSHCPPTNQFPITSPSDIPNERHSESKLVSQEHQEPLFSVEITPKQRISLNYRFYFTKR